PSPFPGMDPYLELPSLWPDVHARIIYELARTLRPLVRPRYHLRFEERFIDVPASELVALDVVGIGDVLVTRRGDQLPGGNGRDAGGMDGERAGAEPQSTGPAVLTVEL